MTRIRTGRGEGRSNTHKYTHGRAGGHVTQFQTRSFQPLCLFHGNKRKNDEEIMRIKEHYLGITEIKKKKK